MAEEDTAVPKIQIESENKHSAGSDDSDEPVQNKTKKSKLHPRSHERRDSGSSVGEDDELITLTDEKKEKIVTQAEFYFSDENLKHDGFLLKHVKRNKEGYVNLKLLASFKKMRSLSRDYRVIGEALKNSEKLVINETGLKVRRVDPLPKELLNQVRVSHIVCSSIPFETPTMNQITESFYNNKDDIVSVRIVKPGKKFPNDLQSHFSKNPKLREEIVAIVEFENPDTANEAVKTDFKGESKGMMASLLQLGPKQSKKKENGETASDTPVDSDTGADQSSKKKSARLHKLAALNDSYASSSDNEFSSFSSCGKRHSRQGSPVSSPTLSRRKNQNKNNSKNNSPLSSPANSPRFNRKNENSGINLKLSPLVNNSSPRSSPETRRKNYTQMSSSPSQGQSPWMLRKKLQLNENNVPTENGVKVLDVVRQPKGPDGSNGFSNHPLKKFILVHAC